MSSPLKDFFHYSKGERRGTLWLLTILLILLIFYFFQQWKSITPNKTSHSEQVIIERFSADTYNKSKYSKAKTNISYFDFDPNTIGVEDWQKLGFSEKQAKSIEKYKSAGAQFFKKEDLKKLFVVDEEKYLELEPYINIEKTDNSSGSSNYKKYKYDKIEYPKSDYDKPRYRIVTIAESSEPIYNGLGTHELEMRYSRTDAGYKYVLVANLDSIAQLSVLTKAAYENITSEDINSLKGYYRIKAKEDKAPQKIINIKTADTTEVKSLRGIGSSFAKRIIKYRNMIGGFISKEQLKEVYGLDQDKYDQIEAFIKVDPNDIVKININSATVDELKTHPYIDWKMANSIFFYRQSHGNYTQVEDIKNSDLITDELFSKIAPYITVQ
jgi:competence ComEA-like helix-hairpin-helix protein